MDADTGATGVFSPRIVDSLVDAILIVEAGGNVLYANPAVERLLGWKVESLFGVPFVTLMPERSRTDALARFDNWITQNPAPRGRPPRRVMMLRADGSELPVDVGALVVAPGEGSRLAIAVLWDVSGRVDIEHYQRISDELLALLAGALGTVDEVVPQLLATLAGSMDFEFATAWRWDPHATLLSCEHVWRRDLDQCGSLAATSTGMTVQSGEGLAGLVVSSNEPMWLTELTRSPHLRRHEAIVTDGLRTAFLFPMRATGRLVGVIELFTKAHRQPDGPLTEAVADIGAKLGEFIERLELESQRNELLAQLRHSQRQQEFLLRANRALAGAGDFHDAIRRLAIAAVPTLGDICLVDVTSSDGTLVRLAAKHADARRQAVTDELGRHAPDITGPHPAACAVRTGQSQWSTDMTEGFLRSTTQGEQHYELTRLLGFESYVSVPLLANGNAIGALTLVAAGSGRQFGKEELALAENLAAQVASVIERAQALDEQSTIAHLLQHSLLPAGLDQVPGIAVGARYVPSSRVAEVGGDFYDVVSLSDSRVALVIGDVEGHDVTAATVMGQLRSALRAHLLLTADPGRALSLLDDYALAQPTERLATACVAVLDTTTGSIELASAGHPPPFVAADRMPAAPIPVRPGPPLGIGGGHYPVTRLQLPTAANLVFYTDGLIEEGRAGTESRIDEFAQSLNDHPSRSCEALADAILLATASPVPGNDDIAVLVVKWPADGRAEPGPG